VVLRQQLKRGQQLFEINISTLMPGQYFIKVIDGTETINKSFTLIK
jgi:hypothetical protein